MFTALLFSFTVAFVSLAVAAGGAAVLWRGVRGHAVDDHERCRACGYDLGVTKERPSRCTECGISLIGVGKVKAGRRRLRPDLIAVGIGIMLLPIFAAIGLSATSELIAAGPAAVAPKPAPATLAPMAAPAPIFPLSKVQPGLRPAKVAAPRSTRAPTVRLPSSLPRFDMSYAFAPPALDAADEAIARQEIAVRETDAREQPGLYRPLARDAPGPLHAVLGQETSRRPPSIETTAFSLFPPDVEPSLDVPRGYVSPLTDWGAAPRASSGQLMLTPWRWSATPASRSSLGAASLRSPSLRTSNAAASTRVTPSRVVPRPATR